MYNNYAKLLNGKNNLQLCNLINESYNGKHIPINQLYTIGKMNFQ